MSEGSGAIDGDPIRPDPHSEDWYDGYAAAQRETTPAGVLDEKRTWPTRDEFRRMSPAEVNRFLASIGVSTRVVDPATPASVLDEAALRTALEVMWPHHTEGVGSSPPSPGDHSYEVWEPFLPGSPDSVARALAAALGRSGSDR